MKGLSAEMQQFCLEKGCKMIQKSHLFGKFADISELKGDFNPTEAFVTKLLWQK